MGYDFYVQLNTALRRHRLLCGGLVAADRLITWGMLLFYPGFLGWLWYATGDVSLAARCVLIPACGFFCVSVVRYFLKAPRPYECCDITPLNGKRTVAKSFPSRHVFSIFMIAETYLYGIGSARAAILFALGLVLMVTRVLLGVHFVRDVVCGALFALLCGGIYFI